MVRLGVIYKYLVRSDSQGESGGAEPETKTQKQPPVVAPYHIRLRVWAKLAQGSASQTHGDIWAQESTGWETFITEP